MGGKSKGPSAAELAARKRAEDQRRLLEQQQQSRQDEQERKVQSKQTLARRRGLGRASLIATSETGTKGNLG